MRARIDRAARACPLKRAETRTRLAQRGRNRRGASRPGAASLDDGTSCGMGLRPHAPPAVASHRRSAAG